MGARLTYAAPLCPNAALCRCASQTWNIKGRAYTQRHSGIFRGDGLLVDSSPRYIFNPLVPYRIHMVRPGAKFVIVLRDPTDRYLHDDCPGISSRKRP